MRSYLSSLDPQLPRDVYVLQTGGLLNSFGNGVVLPFLIIYLHNVRGISLGVAGLAAATQSTAALASAFLAGTLSDRAGPKRVLVAALCVMTVAFALMPQIRVARQAFAIYLVWGIGSGAFWPAQSSLLAGLAPPARRAAAYGLQRLVMNLGVAVGGVVAGLIASVSHPGTFTILFGVDCATFLAYVLVLLRVRTPALHSDRARGSWAAVARDRTFVAVTALNATFMAAAIALMVELLPAFAKNVAGVGECLHAAVHGPLSADLAPPQLVGRYLALSNISWQPGWIVGPAGGGFFLQHAPLLLWPSAAGINLLCAGWALALERRLPEHVRLTPRGVEPEGFGAGAAG